MYSAGSEVDDAFSYFEGTSTKPSKYAKLIDYMVQAGYIDCLHTWGNFSQKGGFERNMAIQAAKELASKGMQVCVWTNHGTLHDFQNIGYPGFGDLPELVANDGTRIRSLEYHADLSVDYGIRFVWTGDLTDTVGQDRPLRMFESLFGDKGYTKSHRLFLSGLKALIKRMFQKSIPGYLVQNNHLIFIDRLRDGQKILKFKRFGSWKRNHADDLSHLISPEVLRRLKSEAGYMVLYVHLGKGNLTTDSKAALENLKNEFKNGMIYVTTTSKLLNYNLCNRFLKWNSQEEGGETRISIKGVADPVRGDYQPSFEELQGITFYTSNPEKTLLYLNRDKIEVIHNPPDMTGRKSIMIPLKPLGEPDLFL